MKYERKVRRIGNSLGVGLPSEILKKINIKDGDTIHVTEVEGKIILTNPNYKESENDFKKRVIAIIEEYMNEQKESNE